MNDKLHIVDIEVNNIKDNPILNFVINDKNYTVKILSKCGSGGYGTVFNCIVNDENNFVIKFNDDEKPNMLSKNIKSFGKANFIIKYLCAGKVRNNHKYKFYSIMQHGGDTLDNFFIDKTNIKNILTQLFDIVKYIQKNKILCPDFKIHNITIDDKQKINLIDIYLYYSKNFNKCKLVRTYIITDLSVDKSYNNANYNFSYIYSLFGFLLIDLFCDGMSYYKDAINKKFNRSYNKKDISIIIQLGFLLYNFDDYKQYISETLEKKILNFYEADKKITDIFKYFCKKLHFNKKFNFDFEPIEIFNHLIIPIPQLRNINIIEQIFKL